MYQLSPVQLDRTAGIWYCWTQCCYQERRLWVLRHFSLKVQHVPVKHHRSVSSVLPSLQLKHQLFAVCDVHTSILFPTPGISKWLYVWAFFDIYLSLCSSPTPDRGNGDGFNTTVINVIEILSLQKQATLFRNTSQLSGETHTSSSLLLSLSRSVNFKHYVLNSAFG